MDKVGQLQAMVLRRRTTQAIDDYLEQVDINSVDQFGSTLLHVVAQSTGNRALTEYAINSGADIDALDAEGYTPLALACTSQFNGPVFALLDAGANPNASTTRHPLLYAIVKRDVQLVKTLLDAGANTQAQDSATGMTPSAAASLYGATTIAKLIEDHEERLSIQKEQQTLLGSIGEARTAPKKLKM